MKDCFEYSCIGRATVKKCAVLICASVISSVLFGVASVETSVFSPYFKLVSIAFLFLSILIFVRFIGTRYSYKLIIYPSGESDFMIAELRGFFGKSHDVKVNRTVCRVSVTNITDVTVIRGESGDEKLLKALKKKMRSEKAAIYNYTSVIFLSEFAILKIEDGDGISYVRFSPDEELLRLLRNCISQ